MSPFVRLGAICAVTFMFAACFLGLAGRVDWVWGWICIGLLIAGSTIDDLVRYIGIADVLTLRRKTGNAMTWEGLCIALFSLSFEFVLIVGALDAGRFQATWMPTGLQVIGVLAFCGGQAIITWSMLVDPFFDKSAQLRDVGSRGVIDTGPYACVRHPGHTGTIAAYAVGAPLMLGSWWAFIPAGVAVLSLIARAILADRHLRAELADYDDYCKRVPSRLMPFIWMQSEYPPPAR